MKKYLAILLSLLMVLALVPSVASAATPVELANWTIASSATTKTGVFSTSMSDITRSDSATMSYSGGNRYGGSGWAEGDAILFSAPTTGYNTITVQGEVRASKTGPASVQLQAKVSGTWTSFGSSIVIGNTSATTTCSFGPTAITGVDNAATVEFRLVVDTTLGGNGSAIASGGTMYIEDSLIISGVAAGGDSPTPTIPATPPETVEPSPEPTLSTILSAKEAYADGSTDAVKVEGIVTFMDPASSGTMMNIYFEDTTAGLDVYQTAANAEGIAVGDKISVVGTLTTYKGLVEMGTSAVVTKLSSGNTLPLTEGDIGMMVSATPFRPQCRRYHLTDVTLAADGTSLSDGMNTIATYKLPADVDAALLGAKVDVIGILGWYDNAQFRVAAASDVVAHSTIPLTPNTYTLTITTPENGTITVMKGTDALVSGATITEDDELTISATANENYNLTTLTVNGNGFTSGNTHTVAGDVTVAATFTSAPVIPPPPTNPPTVAPVTIKMLGTSDIHGQLFATDYTAAAAASGTYKRGLTRVATYVKEQRAAYQNVFLVDTGDLIQGTPLTYYYAFNQPTVDDPAMKALRTMGYDLFVPGNHEFNYGMTILQRQLGYLTSAATTSESQVAVSTANYLAAATNDADTKDWATWNGYAPYIVKNYDGVRVAYMGIGNPNVPKWDVPANWDGIYFAGVLETYLHYEAEMQAAADIIVICSHSGINSDAGSDFIEELIKTTNSIDLAFTGHEHKDAVTVIKNADGKDINVLSPYTKARKIADAELVFDPETDELTVTAKIVAMENYALDEELVEVLQPYETATWNDYMNNKIGEAAGPYSALNLGTAPSAFMDLINRVQLWGAYDATGENTPDDESDDTMAQLSISAPLTSGDATELIPTGDIFLGDMFKLYRYENWFYQITMTGKEVKTWLEFAATKIRVTEDKGSTVTVSNSDLTYYDVIYGDGFYYMIDPTQPEGSRIVKMTYNGTEVADDDTFTVVVNNYRYNGGGNYVKYLNDNGCTFVANDPDRIIYSTQYDMIQGEDKGQARNLLADYISEKQIITPDITSTWEIKTEYDFELLGDQGYQAEYEIVGENELLWNVTLSELAEGEFLNSLQFNLGWDATKLALMEIVEPEYDVDITTEDYILEINTNKTGDDLATASELDYALAGPGKLMFKGDENIVLTLRFKILDTVPEEEQLDITVDGVVLSLVDADNADIDEMWYVNGVDGYIIVRRVNKDALIAEVAKDNGIMDDEALVTSADGKDIPNGTEYLTNAEVIANEAAIAAAQEVIDDVLATQAEVDAALAALQAAFVEPHAAVVDKTALIAEDAKDDAIMADTALVIAENDDALKAGTKWLTEAEKAANTAALAAAQAVIDKADATQNQVDAALAALIAAFITPHTADIDMSRLEAAIAYAEEFIKSDAYDDCSDKLQDMWDAALAAAQAQLTDPNATQLTVNAAADAIYALPKTGEATNVYVFAGLAILAVLALAVGVKRRFATK